VKARIQEIVGDGVTLIDTGAAVAKHLQNRLNAMQLLADENRKGEVRFWTNNPAADAKPVIELLWGKAAQISVQA
jgi:glutamate racemase